MNEDATTSTKSNVQQSSPKSISIPETESDLGIQTLMYVASTLVALIVISLLFLYQMWRNRTRTQRLAKSIKDQGLRNRKKGKLKKDQSQSTENSSSNPATNPTTNATDTNVYTKGQTISANHEPIGQEDPFSAFFAQISLKKDENGKCDSVSVTYSGSRQPKIISIPGYLKLDLVDVDLTNRTFLGKGGTSVVHKVTLLVKSKSANVIERYAYIKEAALKTITSLSQESFLFEVAIMGSIPRHENIVQFYGYTEDPNSILLELCPQTLAHVAYIGPNGEDDMTATLIKSAAIQIAQACRFIHSQGIVHFDLKTQNIMLKPLPNGTVAFKVTDFGCARIVIENDNDNDDVIGPEFKGTIGVPASGLEIPDDYGFSWRYCSPEVLQLMTISNTVICTKKYFKSDIYSFAIILYELVSGSKAWDTLPRLLVLRAVTMGVRPTLEKFRYDRSPKSKSEKNEMKHDFGPLSEIIELAWTRNPMERPSFDIILDRLI